MSQGHRKYVVRSVWAPKVALCKACAPIRRLFYMLEQPKSSVMFQMPHFKHLWSLLKLVMVSTWLGYFGHALQKDTKLLCNFAEPDRKLEWKFQSLLFSNKLLLSQSMFLLQWRFLDALSDACLQTHVCPPSWHCEVVCEENHGQKGETCPPTEAVGKEAQGERHSRALLLQDALWYIASCCWRPLNSLNIELVARFFSYLQWLWTSGGCRELGPCNFIT